MPIRTTGMQGLLDRLQAASEAAIVSPRVTVTKAAFLLRYALKVQAPIRTGKLKASIRFTTAADGDGFSAQFWGIYYARYVYRGTAPHLIRPRFRRALMWPGAPHPVKLVHHPGTRPNRFRIRAWDSVKPTVTEMLRLVGQEIIEGKGLE